MGLKKLVAVGALGWLYTKMPPNPKDWPAFVGEQLALVKDQAREAAEAGKRANVRRQEQLAREVAEAMGQTRVPGGISPERDT